MLLSLTRKLTEASTQTAKTPETKERVVTWKSGTRLAFKTNFHCSRKATIFPDDLSGGIEDDIVLQAWIHSLGF